MPRLSPEDAYRKYQQYIEEERQRIRNLEEPLSFEELLSPEDEQICKDLGINLFVEDSREERSRNNR